METVNLSGSTRIPYQLKLLTACTRTTDPAAVFEIWAGAMQQVYGPRRYVVVNLKQSAAGGYSIGLLIDEGGRDRVRAADPMRGDGLPVHHGGLLESLISTPEPKLLPRLGLRDDPVLGEAIADYGSLMAVPIFEEGVARNFLIVLDRNPDAFSVPELEELNLRVNLVGVMVSNLRMASELRRAQRHIQREIDRIASIQRALLPQPIPHIAGANVAAVYEVYDRAGGDLYDIRQLGPQLWMVLIADASGHGPAAAVQAAMFHSLIRADLARTSGPATLLSHANRHLCDKRIGDSFVTAFLGIYDSAQHLLTHASAGHPPPLIKSQGSNDTRYLDEPRGFPLGIEEEGDYEESVTRLEPAQTLLLYTDGVSEAMNAQRQMFGNAGIEHAISRCDGDADCIVQTLAQAVRVHEGEMLPCDDRTILAMQPAAAG